LSVSEFAAQTNAVATALLNNQMPLDTARVYSALARTVAQAMSAQVAVARAKRTTPDLTLNWNPNETDEV